MACYLFGSRAAGKVQKGNDVDLAFLLDDPILPDKVKETDGLFDLQKRRDENGTRDY